MTTDDASGAANTPRRDDTRTGDEAANSYAARGGWIGPSDEAIAEGRAAREPMEADAAWQKLQAEGRLEHAEVKRLTIPKDTTVAGEIEIQNSTLRMVRFNGVTFSKRVVFRYCSIEGMELRNATFAAGLVFESCEFRHKATRLQDVTVADALRIRNCTTRGKFTLANVEIGSQFDGWDTTFEGWVDFFHVRVAQSFDLRSADFDEGLVIKGCTIGQDLNMRGASVQKKFEVRDTTVNGCLDLQKARLLSFSYLDDVSFGPDATVSVWNCAPHALLINPEQLKGRISPLTRKDGKATQPELLSKKIPAGQDSITVGGTEYVFDHNKAAQEYGVLKNNYQRNNQLDEEDWAYYWFKVHSRRGLVGTGGISGAFGRFMDWLVFDYGCAYGTSPMRVLRTAGMVILSFAVIYAIAIFSMSTPAAEAINTDSATAALSVYRIVGVDAVDKALSAVLHSTGVFVFGFDSIDKNVEGWPAILLAIQGVIGTLLFGLFIVSFSRKVIR